MITVLTFRKSGIANQTECASDTCDPEGCHFARDGKFCCSSWWEPCCSFWTPNISYPESQGAVWYWKASELYPLSNFTDISSLRLRTSGIVFLPLHFQFNSYFRQNAFNLKIILACQRKIFSFVNEIIRIFYLSNLLIFFFCMINRISFR